MTGIIIAYSSTKQKSSAREKGSLKIRDRRMVIKVNWKSFEN